MLPATKDNAIYESMVATYGHTDWKKIAYLLNVSRRLDALEENELAPAKKVLYQFSARGHDFAQIVLGSHLTNANDAICGYYRSRPILLALGVDLTDALGSAMAKRGGYSDGRDIGVVFNYPNSNGASALPMCGGVGAQYTPIAGWSQALNYRHAVLKEKGFDQSIGVVLGGDGSVATNGFWAALTMATTLDLPMLFFIEDNRYGLSVPSDVQTPGGNIAKNLGSFGNLKIISGDGAQPGTTEGLIDEAVGFVRHKRKPCLLRLDVPRLEGHSLQDTQTYKSDDFIDEEWRRDPLPRLRQHLVPEVLAESEWQALEDAAGTAVKQACQAAEQRADPDPTGIKRFVFAEPDELQARGGLRPEGYEPPAGTPEPNEQGQRINMLTAIRQTLDHELAINPKVVVFGEDVGAKGGVHAATLGLQRKHGADRVFDTSLSEEGIIGRSVGMALAGLMPVPEIQFRKYADPAAEQLNDCGSMRWRTHNHFAAPMVVRIPNGFFKCGDPWHSQTNEVQYVHSPGWQVAVPSNAQDAAGLLRTALRGNNPVIFFEHRAMLDAASARRVYPGDDYMLEFGRARTVASGDQLTIVTWGAMVARCQQAAEGQSVDILDLRTLMPWDRAAVLNSVGRTHRCLVVHEDLGTAGFGAEIAAVVADEAFLDLDAPVSRLTMPDVPSPHHPILLDAVVPTVDGIRQRIKELLEF